MSTPPPAPLHSVASAEAPPPIASTSTASTNPPTPSTAPTLTPGLSKNAQKRLLKQQAFEAAKPARRAKERALKKEKAAEKRKLIELGVLEKPVSKKAMRAERGGIKPFRARVVVDCAFDDKMTDKEVKSMAAQLAFCYSSNRSSHRPLDLMISGLSGRMKAKFESTPGKPHESWKGVEWWEEGYEELWAEPAPTPSTSAAVTSVESSANGEVPPGSTPTTPAVTPIPPVTIGTLNGQPRSRVPKSSIIYLTGDSPNVLTTLEEGKTYILGGIVDRNRYKRLCFDKAEQHGIQHAQLPIAEFMPDMPTRKVLTVNQVYDILIQYVETDSWAEALKAVMPSRKMVHGARTKGGKKDGAVEVEGGEGEEDGEDVYEVGSDAEMPLEEEERQVEGGEGLAGSAQAL